MEEMVEKFSFDRVSKTGGIFDKDKLDWVNGHYIRSESLERIKEMTLPYLIEAGYMDEDFARDNSHWVDVLIETVREGLATVNEVVEKVEFIFEENPVYEAEAYDEFLNNENGRILMEAIKKEAMESEEITLDNAKDFMKRIQKNTGIKGKNLFMPTRVALTGSAHGPELVNVLYLLGNEKIAQRAQKVLDIID